MKFLRETLVLVTVLVACAALLPTGASATELWCGASMCAAETTISAESEGKVVLDTPIGNIECNSTVSGHTEKTGSSSETVKGPITTLTFTSCGSDTVTVLSPGSLEIHTQNTTANNNGTLTSTGTKVTVLHSGVDCIFETSGTDIGTLTGSATTGGNATLDISARIPRTGGSSGVFCGESAPWTGSYKFTSPSTLNIDGGGATSTTTTTSLSGESRSGEEITVNEGSKVKDQATISGTNAGKATGTVKYKVYADKECKELVTSAGEVTVTSGKVPASEEKELEAGRVYYWQAEYSGDTNNLKSTSTCGKEVLTVKAKTSIATTLSGESKSGEELTVNEGSKVKDTATLSGTRSASATGKVKFKAYKDKECKELASEAGEGSLSEGKASSEEKALEAGAVYYWQAEYPGDSLHQASTSSCGKEVLTVKAATSLSTTLLGGGEEGEEITVGHGSLVADTAALSGTRSNTATGTIFFNVYADSECKELVAEAGKVAIAEGVILSSEELELEEGTYYWQAEYEGDSLHQSSNSACGKEVLVVNGATSVTTSLSGGGQEGAEVEVIEGAAVSDAATLAGKNVATATGTVTYAVYADSECEQLVAEAGEVSVEGKTVSPSSKVMLEEPGVYYWQARYSGDTANHGAVSGCGSEIEVVSPPLTTTLSSGESSGDGIEVAKGTAITDEATLYGEHASEATGTVKYLIYADEECKELVSEAGEVSVEGGSAPPSEKETLEPGVYYWQAEYSGDAHNPAATSTCGSEVARIVTPTSVATSLSGGEEEGPEIKVKEGMPVRDVATLSGTNAATAVGSVAYSVYADAECEELISFAGTSSVEEGTALPSDEETLPAGIYYWQAEYSGDGTNQGSTSTCGTEKLTVTAPLTTTLSTEERSGEDLEVVEGTAVRDDATLHSESAPEASGKLKYKVYADSECKELVTEAGEVTLKEATAPLSLEEELKAGTYYWQAEYLGDTKNPPAASACGTEELVVDRPETTKYAAIGDSFSAGQGIRTYYTRTNQTNPPKAHENLCHRSKKAWPALVAETLFGAAAVKEENEVFKQDPPSFIFRACSGAKTTNLWSNPPNPNGGQEEEAVLGPPEKWLNKPSQNLWLLEPGGDPPPAPVVPNNKIKYVTVTIGGNDVNFATVAERCIKGLPGPPLGPPKYSLEGCFDTILANEALLATVVKPNLKVVLSNIHVNAPKAKILVLFYPRIINPKTNVDIRVGGAFGARYTLDATEVLKAPVPMKYQTMKGLTAVTALNRFVTNLNNTLEETVLEAQAAPLKLPVEILESTQSAFVEHRLGEAKTRWVNSMENVQRVEMFHPNECGHIALARAVLEEMKGKGMDVPPGLPALPGACL